MIFELELEFEFEIEIDFVSFTSFAGYLYLPLPPTFALKPNTMKTHYTLSLLFLFLQITFTYAQVEWLTQSTENDQGTHFEGRASGNDLAMGLLNEMYVTGTYSGETTFDTITINANPSSAVYLARYEDNGRVKWVRRVLGNSNNDAHAVATNDSGHVYMAGEYVHTNANTILNFGNLTLTGNRSASTFIAKADADGEFLWAVRILATDAPSVQYAKPVDMEMAPNGDIIVLGNVIEPVEIEGQMYNTTTSDNEMMYLARFKPDGSLLWFRNTTIFGTPGGHIDAANLAIGSQGQLYVNGNLTNSGLLWGTDTLSAPDGTGQFLARFNGNGDLEWWRTQSARVVPQFPHKIGMDAQDNVYITMRSAGGAIYLTDTLLSPPHGFMGRRVLLKYSPTGERLFMKEIGVGEFPASGGISDFDMTATTLPDGKTFITGMYGGNGTYMVFGNTDTVPMPPSFQERQFMVAFDGNGNYLDIGFMIDEYLSLPDVQFATHHMMGDANGKLHMTGEFRYDYRLGNDTLRTVSTLSQMFLLKLDPTLLMDLTTSLEDKQITLPQVSIYPNPTSDILNISFEKQTPQDQLEVALYTLSGHLLEAATLKNEVISWEISDLPSGTYVVMIEGKGQVIGKRVVKR